MTLQFASSGLEQGDFATLSFFYLSLFFPGKWHSTVPDRPLTHAALRPPSSPTFLPQTGFSVAAAAAEILLTSTVILPLCTIVGAAGLPCCSEAAELSSIFRANPLLWQKGKMPSALLRQIGSKHLRWWTHSPISFTPPDPNSIHTGACGLIG